MWNQVILAIGDTYAMTVGHLVSAVVMALTGWLSSRLLSRFVGRRLASSRLRPDDILVIQRVIFYTALVLVVFASLSLLNVPLTAFAFLSGTIAIGLGFGAQNIINNFISGWILLSTRPVKMGDFVEVDGQNGVVERITSRATQIRRVDGVHLLVPNAIMLEKTVVNWTHVDDLVRTSLRVGVEYGSNVARVRDLLTAIATGHASVVAEPPPLVVFDDFGDSALIFEVIFWCHVNGERMFRVVRSDLRFEIERRFAEEGIVIAFPQQVTHLRQDSPLNLQLLPASDGPKDSS